MTTIGIIGAGKIGSQLARLSISNGHDVVISNSRGPESLADLISELGPRARAATTEEVAEAGELVIVTIPLRAVPEIPAAPLAGKIVIDTNNYYPERDGSIAELDDESLTTSEWVQRHLPESRVVKAFNHFGFNHFTTANRPTGSPDRIAFAIASDDEEAKRIVGDLIDEFGFDALDAGSLADSWRIQRDTPGYGKRQPVDALRADLAAAKRYRDM